MAAAHAQAWARWLRRLLCVHTKFNLGDSVDFKYSTNLPRISFLDSGIDDPSSNRSMTDAINFGYN